MIALAFLGRSGSGKTTVIESLLPLLKLRGLRVAVVKHAHHRGIELEPPGKDTARMRRAGAVAVALVAPDQLFTLESRATEPSLDEVLARLPPADLAIVESWKALALPFVEVIGPPPDEEDEGAEGAEGDGSEGSSRVVPAPGALRIAVVGAADAAGGEPRFAPSDSEGLAERIVRWARGDG